MTPKQALREGADYIVMGRAILNHSDPLKAVGVNIAGSAYSLTELSCVKFQDSLFYK